MIRAVARKEFISSFTQSPAPVPAAPSAGARPGLSPSLLLLLLLNLHFLATPSLSAGGASGNAAEVVDHGETVPEPETEYSEDLLVTAYATSAATRTETPLFKIPQSISVLPSRVLEEQATTRVSDAVSNASGVIRAYGLGGTNDSVTIRGFPPDSILRDGIASRFFLGFEETANVERIEVVKGPNSALYGQGQLGGFVNLVTKQPSPDLAGSVGVALGSEGHRKLNLDASGPLGARAEYRLVAAAEDSESFRDEVEVERRFVTPSLRWRPTDASTLTVSAERSEQDAVYDFGLPIVDGEIVGADVGEFYGEPWSRIRSDVTRAGYDFQWFFGGGWTLRNVFRFQENEEEDVFVLPIVDTQTAGSGLLQRRASFLFEPSETYDLYLEIRGSLEAGRVRHTLLLGTEVYRISSGFQFGFVQAPPPVPLAGRLADAPVPALPGADDDTPRRSTRQNGVYLQDQLDVGDRWSFLLGGRWTEERGEDLFRVTGDEKFTPRVGVVLLARPTLSLYTSWSTSFQSNTAFGTTIDGEPFAPLEGEQVEVGVKSDLLQGNLSVTGALYDLRRKNVPTADVDNPGFSVLVGEERSRGLEVDGVLRLGSSLRLAASYSWVETEILRSNTDIQGNRLANFPEHSGRIWATYHLPSGRLHGLGFSAGVTAMDKRPVNNANSFFLDGYAAVDAAVFWSTDRWRVGLNVDNLLDEQYFRLGGPFGPSAVPGGPREARLSISVRAW